MSDKPSGELMWKFILTLATAAIAAMGTTLFLHETRLNTIEANRFNDTDAFEMERRIMGNTPPVWFQERVLSLERRIDALGERIDGAD